MQFLSAQFQSADNQALLPISTKEEIIKTLTGKSFEVKPNDINHLLNLPSEEELRRIVEEEQEKLRSIGHE